MAELPTAVKKQPKPSSGTLKKETEKKSGNLSREVIHQTATFEGPMPPPAILEGYEKLVPGAAERILSMAESDAKHQRELEFAALRATENEIKRGQNFALIVALASLSAAMYALYLGYPTVAGIIGGTTVVGLVSAFIIGRYKKSG